METDKGLGEATENLKRHPWELARFNTLAKILEMIEDPECIASIFDVGYGKQGHWGMRITRIIASLLTLENFFL